MVSAARSEKGVIWFRECVLESSLLNEWAFIFRRKDGGAYAVSTGERWDDAFYGTLTEFQCNSVYECIQLAVDMLDSFNVSEPEYEYSYSDTSRGPWKAEEPMWRYFRPSTEEAWDGDYFVSRVR